MSSSASISTRSGQIRTCFQAMRAAASASEVASWALSMRTP